MKKKQYGKFTYPKTIETFRNIGEYELLGLHNTEPSAFNGLVRIKKFRITVEEIEEPREVYIERLQKLGEECDNYHHVQPLRSEALKLKYEFPENTRGINRKK